MLGLQITSPLLTMLSDLQLSSKYSDLIIACGGKDFKVHRAVVCMRSTYFANVCNGDWNESNTRVVDARHHNTDAIGCMVSFLYTNDYQTPQPDPACTIHPIGQEHILHARVYGLGEYYNVPDLKLLALRAFMDTFPPDDEYENFYPGDYLALVQEVYSTTPEQDRGLRDIIVDYAVKGSADLLRKIDVGAFDNDDFANDLISALARDRAEQIDKLSNKSEENEGLKSENKKLRIEVKERDILVTESQTQSAQQEAEYKKLRRDHDELVTSHGRLKSDHTRLQSDHACMRRAIKHGWSEKAASEEMDDEGVTFVRTGSQKRQRNE